MRHLPLCSLIALIGASVFAPQAQAVIIAGGDGTGNTTAPGDDFGFANVGRVFDPQDGIFCAGIYLGSGWVLSAYHPVRDATQTGFSFGSVVFGVTSYTVSPGSGVRLQNADTSLTDLALFQLTTLPPLPSVSISATTPDVGSAVIMMGNGSNRVASETHWDVNTVPNPDLWTETGGAGDRQGYKWAGGASLRWGTNTLESFNGFSLPPLAAPTGVVNDGFGNVTMIKTDFDNVAGEAQVAGGDSGGGVFFKNGSNWELSGIMLTRSLLSGQPDQSSVYSNLTLAADLATYRDQIVAIVPEPGSVGLMLGGGAILLARRRRVGTRR